MGNKFTAPYSAPSHTPGTPKGEEQIENLGKEPGRDTPKIAQRTARDSTSVDPESKGPIDPRMPNFPPA
ncbi:MAG: hypothetical protein ACR2N3_16530 [Pyrinomonadaceae bacterium]